MQPKHTLRVGVDIGSTTVKFVVLDGPTILFQRYERHHARSRETASALLGELAQKFPETPITIAFAGSAALNLAAAAELPFVQEVYATRLAVQERLGDVDVVVELGGEDAKILFLTNGLEERMNGSCAGGTGAFIDQMAALLSLSLEELDALSFEHTELYPIASRCGVFAKSDIQPLLNQGANKADIAASIYQSIVNQTISGLAQGRDIQGTVVFLGGPLTFLKGLRVRFTETLGLQPEKAMFPESSEYYVALGAAQYSAQTPETTLTQARVQLETAQQRPSDRAHALPPLFQTPEDYAAFSARHAAADVPRRALESYEGPAYLGIDAGSTTTKLALIDPNGTLLFQYYAPNSGDPLQVVQEQLLDLRRRCGTSIVVESAAVTGYGEELIQNAFRIEFGLVETTAHAIAAQTFLPEVAFIIDIGGQDMKCFQMQRGTGVVDSILLNEACSSGCGSFLEAFANALNLPVADFAKLGLFAPHPVNLGSRCTVFMNSSVKQAQNDGASVEDISAGLSISVVKNAVYKVIRAHSAQDLGEHIVVQGGTFLNDAVLRAFEQELGRTVTRPVIAGLMGAYGAALYAQRHTQATTQLPSIEELERFHHTANPTRCGLCGNRCNLTITTFSDGRRSLSGNRCEKPLHTTPKKSLPDAYEFKKKLLLSYAQKQEHARGVIGIPLGLGTYELLPFWATLLREMGYSIEVSGLSSRELYLKGQHTIPSDTVCYPAKLTHGHIEALLERGVRTIFYPCLPYHFDEKQGDNHYNCPVVAFYPELLQANIPALTSSPDQKNNPVRYLCPYLAPHAASFLRLAAQYFFRELGVPKPIVRAAVRKAYMTYDAYRNALYSFGDSAIRTAKEQNKELIILAGRPYHADPEINHGVHKLLTGLDCVVISEDCLRPKAKPRLGVLNQWTFHSRLYAAAHYAAEHEHVQLVQLVSFGCGLDAITSDEVKEILTRSGKHYTLLKIDEINHLGAAKIRLRSLLEALKK